MIGERWKIYASHRTTDRGVAHWEHRHVVGYGGAARQVSTLCGLALVPLAVDAGTKAAACGECLKRGAKP